MIKTFYLRRDEKTLFLTGHFNAQEIKELECEGYQERAPIKRNRKGDLNDLRKVWEEA